MVTGREFHVQNDPFEAPGGAMKIAGFTTANVPEVETNTKALRITLKPTNLPPDFGAYTYMKGTDASFTVATPNVDNIRLSATWLPTTGIAVIRRVNVGMAVLVVSTSLTAGTVDFKLWRVRNYQSTSPAFLDQQLPYTEWGNLAPETSPPYGKQFPLLRTRQQDAILQIWTTPQGGQVVTRLTEAADLIPFACITAGIKTTSGQTPIPFQPLYEARPGEPPLVLSSQMGIDITFSNPICSNAEFALWFMINWDEYDLDPGLGI